MEYDGTIVHISQLKLRELEEKAKKYDELKKCLPPNYWANNETNCGDEVDLYCIGAVEEYKEKARRWDEVVSTISTHD